MATNDTTFARLISTETVLPDDQAPLELALFDEDGDPVTIGASATTLAAGSVLMAEAVVDISTADGSDPATTQALANANKAKINELLASLRVAGLLDS